jgi:hypothetical protein
MKIKKGVRRAFVIIVVVLFLGLVGLGIYFGMDLFKSVSGDTNKTVVVEKNEDYKYNLEDDAPKAYKKMFKELLKELEKDELVEEKYVELVAKLFVLDFYHLDNKMSKNDIGGVQFVLGAYQQDFVFEASETVYKYMEHNVYKDRKQELPKVKEVTIVDTSNEKYKYNDYSDDNAYVVKANIEYEKDLGYPTTVTIKLLHTKTEKDKVKLEVYYMK